jgi:long-subunit acyl-CoA synthetase (AMP-forming)
LGQLAIVPLPLYFTPSQLDHVINTSGIDTLVARGVQPFVDKLDTRFEPVDERIDTISLLRYAQLCPADDFDRLQASKITFTSGSTGQPKGVSLGFDTIDQVSARLCALFAELGIQQHLCVMPLATLLENIAGVYVPLMLGATVHVPSLATLGLYGSSQLDADRFVDAIDMASAESLILQPQLLRALTAAYRESGRRNRSLKFVAVGGAKVAQSDIDDALAFSIPAYQGYGLSECCSVVALNRPGNARPGSVGRPLPGVSVDIDSRGEIIVSGQSMRGYLGERPIASDRVRTGDLGYLDDGFLYVTGRRKNMFITSFGRNVSPEWPEAELLHQPGIAQVCVFGEARPINTAVIVPAAGRGEDDQLAEAVAAANRSLPDYARISDWVVATESFSVANGLLTQTGKPRRDAVELRYIVGLGGDQACRTHFAPNPFEAMTIPRKLNETVR